MTTLPKHVQVLLDELTFIGLTKPNEKICFSTKTTVDGYSMFGWFYRRYYGEGENNLILNLRGILDMIEESLRTADWNDYRIQILIKVIHFHAVIIDQIALYEKYPRTKAELIGIRDRVATILLNISDEEKILIKQRRVLEESKFTINVIGTPPDKGYLASRIENEK